MQHWNPSGPEEVTLAGIPGVELRLPPKPKEVTEAGTPRDWAAHTFAAIAAKNKTEAATLSLI